LVPLVRTLKYSDIEVQFGREVAELKVAAAASMQPTNVAATQRQPIWEELARLSAVRPRTAIRRSWQHVENTLTQLAKSRQLQVAEAVWQMPMVLGALMLNAGVVSNHQYDLLSRLRQLAIEAERAPIDSLDPNDAVEFIGLALRLAASLES